MLGKSFKSLWGQRSPGEGNHQAGHAPAVGASHAHDLVSHSRCELLLHGGAWAQGAGDLHVLAGDDLHNGVRGCVQAPGLPAQHPISFQQAA